MPESFVGEDVDGEVDGRVKYDEHVSDMLQIELETAANFSLTRHHGRNHLVNERRHLADDGNDRENECDTVVLLLAHTLHLHPFPA